MLFLVHGNLSFKFCFSALFCRHHNLLWQQDVQFYLLCYLCPFSCIVGVLFFPRENFSFIILLTRSWKGGKPTERNISKVEKSKVTSFRECPSSTSDMGTQFMSTTSFLTVSTQSNPFLMRILGY